MFEVKRCWILLSYPLTVKQLRGPDVLMFKALTWLQIEIWLLFRSS